METLVWNVITRETSLIEHQCSHGIGHPNFYSAKRLDYEYGHSDGTWSTHGCDGCCLHEDFPGRYMTDEEIIARHEEKLRQFKDKEIDELEMTRWFGFMIHDLRVNERVEIER
jgi:hypothetical protein